MAARVELTGVVLAEIEARPLPTEAGGNVYAVLRYLENEEHRSAYLAGTAVLTELSIFMSVNMASKLLDAISAAGRMAAEQSHAERSH